MRVEIRDSSIGAADAPKPQYSHGDIVVLASRADEPRRVAVSVPLAEDYLRKGALAWKGSRDCVSCHTTGLYMTTRPALTPWLGAPVEEMRAFFVEQLDQNRKATRESLLKDTRPAQVIYIAAGLAEWDAHVTKKLSPETRDGVAQMLEIQLPTGTWGALDCWPPYESDAYHLATVAVMCVATAPGWLAELKDEPQRAAVGRLKNYLRDTSPPHDYGRTLLLWAAARQPDLLPAEKRRELIEMVWQHQRPDGGAPSRRDEMLSHSRKRCG